MNKSNSSLFLLLHGVPGAGKSAFARQFAEDFKLGHIHTDRIRYELYDDASFTAAENNTVLRIALYMTQSLLSLGQNVIFDVYLPMRKTRDALRRSARELGAETATLWMQTDYETARYRCTHRDRRRKDDYYSFQLSPAQFDQLVLKHTPPRPDEEAIVLSGKHSYQQQVAAAKKKLYGRGLLHRPLPMSQRNETAKRKFMYQTRTKNSRQGTRREDTRHRTSRA